MPAGLGTMLPAAKHSTAGQLWSTQNEEPGLTPAPSYTGGGVVPIGVSSNERYARGNLQAWTRSQFTNTTWIGKITISTFDNSGGTGNGVVLAFLDVGAEKAVIFGIVSDGTTNYWGVGRKTYGTNSATFPHLDGINGSNGGTGLNVVPPTVWFKIIDDGTNWQFWHSIDSTNGTDGTWFHEFDETKSAFLASPSTAKICFGVECLNSSSPGAAAQVSALLTKWDEA